MRLRFRLGAIVRLVRLVRLRGLVVPVMRLRLVGAVVRLGLDLGGLVLRHAGHADARGCRMQREHGHQ